MTIVFGQSDGSAMFREAEMITNTPVGVLCLRCCEPIEENDSGVIMPTMIGGWDEAEFTVQDIPGIDNWRMCAMHLECELASLLGHTVGVCPCTRENPFSHAVAIEAYKAFHSGKRPEQFPDHDCAD